MGGEELRQAGHRLPWTFSATPAQKHRDPRFAPYAFTEHRALMVYWASPDFGLALAQAYN